MGKKYLYTRYTGHEAYPPKEIISRNKDVVLRYALKDYNEIPHVIRKDKSVFVLTEVELEETETPASFIGPCAYDLERYPETAAICNEREKEIFNLCRDGKSIIELLDLHGMVRDGTGTHYILVREKSETENMPYKKYTGGRATWSQGIKLGDIDFSAWVDGEQQKTVPLYDIYWPKECEDYTIAWKVVEAAGKAYNPSTSSEEG